VPENQGQALLEELQTTIVSLDPRRFAFLVLLSCFDIPENYRYSLRCKTLLEIARAAIGLVAVIQLTLVPNDTPNVETSERSGSNPWNA